MLYLDLMIVQCTNIMFELIVEVEIIVFGVVLSHLILLFYLQIQHIIRVLNRKNYRSLVGLLQMLLQLLAIGRLGFMVLVLWFKTVLPLLFLLLLRQVQQIIGCLVEE